MKISAMGIFYKDGILINDCQHNYIIKMLCYETNIFLDQFQAKRDDREVLLSAHINTLIEERANLKNVVIYLKAKNNKNNDSTSVTQTSFAIRNEFGWALEPYTMSQK